MRIPHLAFVLLVGLSSTAFASGADGILCTSPTTLPTIPSASAQVAQFAGEYSPGNEYIATLWREPCGPGIRGGIVYLKIARKVGTPFLCGAASAVIQDGLSYDVKFAPRSDEPSDCGYVTSTRTVVVEPRTFPYYKSDDAFTLVFRGESAVSGVSLPAYIAPASFVTPQTGLWWNPAESGSGYALDYKHGVLVVTVYSYTAIGAAQWYLAAAPVTNNTFTAMLERYQNGQCISCAYTGLPTIMGNDGTVRITFTSPTTATMSLPGGRTFHIVPQEF